MSIEEQLPPNHSKLDVALRSIGYSFETAIADIVDNSIDANAKNVLVRLIIKPDGQLDLAIWDDGSGMERAVLKEAMRFGAHVSDGAERLGKFGLGLKLASLSQAKQLYVITASNGSLSGRAWLEQGISHGFTSTLFNEQECAGLIADLIPDRSRMTHGTLVWWSGLYRVDQHNVSSEEHAQRLLRRIGNHLSISFHRFLSGRSRAVGISLDILDRASGMAGIPVIVNALDPFAYDTTGAKLFPATMTVEGEYKDSLTITAHIWPPNSSSPSYKLPGGANSRQGFYFYRNNRLIQGGGWNGMREVEPHMSLARLEVDVSSDFDMAVSLDVKKVEIQLPTALANAIQKAITPSGVDFKKYLAAADNAYRTRTLVQTELPLIPSQGLPSDLARFLQKELRIKATPKSRNLKFKWTLLDPECFFAIDRESGHLNLNSAYRKQLLHGLSGSSADLPVVKCLLFLVLETALSSERVGFKVRERLDQINRILVKAVRYERG